MVSDLGKVGGGEKKCYDHSLKDSVSIKRDFHKKVGDQVGLEKRKGTRSDGEKTLQGEKRNTKKKN